MAKENPKLDLIREKQRLEEEKDRFEREHSVFGSDPRLDIALKEKQIKYIEGQIDSLPASEEVAEDKTVGIMKPIFWQGSKMEFAELVLDLFDRGQIKADSRTDALRQMSCHFVHKDGESFSPKSLLQSIQNKRGYSKKT